MVFLQVAERTGDYDGVGEDLRTLGCRHDNRLYSGVIMRNISFLGDTYTRGDAAGVRTLCKPMDYIAGKDNAILFVILFVKYD